MTLATETRLAEVDRVAREFLTRSGALEGVAVDMPVAFGAFGPDFYRDHFHLNDKGAAVFTEALARDLRTRFASH